MTTLESELIDQLNSAIAGFDAVCGCGDIQHAHDVALGVKETLEQFLERIRFEDECARHRVAASDQQ